jgi:hypothetical protein
MESSEYLYHFTKDKEALKSIVGKGLWVQYSCEDVSFLRRLSDEIDWDRVWDEAITGGDENGVVKQEGRGVHSGSVDRYKVYIPMVCFCDIPHTRLENHAGDDDSTDYGPYAIVLGKEWGRERGLNPVSYAVSESDFSVAFQNFEALTNRVDANHEGRIRSVFRKLLQFLKPYEDDGKRYYDEREWRYIPSGVSTLYTKSKFESNNISQPHSTLYAKFDEIECLVVNDESEVEEVQEFLLQDLHADADEVMVRTLGQVKECGLE